MFVILVSLTSACSTTKTRILAGSSNSFRMYEDGTIKARGLNASGQLGVGSHESTVSPAHTIQVSEQLVKIVSNSGYSVALSKKGHLFHSGRDLTSSSNPAPILSEQFVPIKGKPSQTAGEFAPVNVDGLDFMDIAVGDDFALAIDKGGNLYAWGKNNNSQIPGRPVSENSSATKYTYPTKMTIPQMNQRELWKVIRASKDFAIGITTANKMYSWGSSSDGQLGRPDAVGSPLFGEVQLPAGVDWNFESLSLGEAHALISSKGSEVYGWGLNSQGQLCLTAERNGTPSPFPLQVATPTLIMTAKRSISAGKDFSVFVTDNSTLACGSNNLGQLGLGHKNPVVGAQLVRSGESGTPDIKMVHAGTNHTLALDAQNNVWAWGDNRNKQIHDTRPTSETWLMIPASF